MFKSYISNFKGFPREIWILTILTFINRAGTMVIPFLSKYMKDDLNFTYSQIGWIMVFFGIGSIIGTWLSGKVMAYVGFYKTMIISLFASGVLFFVLEQIKTFEMLCIGILLLTSVADMFRPAMLLSLNSFTRKENRTRALSLVRSAVNLGFLFGPALGGLLIMKMGYKYLFYVDGATCMLAVLIFVLYIREKKLPFKLKENIIAVNGGNKFAVLRDKPFVLHLIISMISGILFFQVFTTLPLYHKEQFHLPEFYSGLLLGLNGIIMLFFELPIVTFVESKHINKLKIISLGLFFMISAFLLLFFVKLDLILVVMMVFVTFGAMLTFPFANSFASSRAHIGLEAKYMSVFTMSYSFAHIFSAKMGMEIIQKFGYDINWLAIAILGTIALLLNLLLYSITKKEKANADDKIMNSLFFENK
jgi:predicted MFS family arabinose efflux permease